MAEVENNIEKITATGKDGRIKQAKGRTPDGNYHPFQVGTPSGTNPLFGRIPNKNKVVNLCFYRYGPNSFLEGDLPKIIDYLRDHNELWDNWKTGIKNGNSNEAKLLPEVPPSVMPVTEDLKIEGGYSYETTSATEAMKKGGGAILGNIRDLAKNAGSSLMSINAAGTAMVEFGKGGDGIAMANKVMGVADAAQRSLTVTSKIDNFGIYDADNVKYTDAKSLKLTFDFGCGGFYDGEVEVVRPIIALATAMAPQFVTGKDSLKNRLALPGANPAQFYAAAWGGTLGGGKKALTAIFDGAKNVGNAMGDMVGNIKSATDAAGTVSAVGNGLLDASSALVTLADEVVKATINGMEYAISAAAGITTVLFYRVGQYIAGPFQVTSVNYNFDYSMVDEAGYPYKGDISLGLRNIYKPDAPDLIAQAGYTFG